ELAPRERRCLRQKKSFGAVAVVRLRRLVEQLEDALPVSLFGAPDLAEKSKRCFLRRIGGKSFLQELNAALDVLMAGDPARSEAKRGLGALGRLFDSGEDLALLLEDRVGALGLDQKI